MRKRRKIRYYNGPAYSAKMSQQVWFPFVATAVAALVLGLLVGAILSTVSAKSKLAKPPARDLAEFGGVEESDEKYTSLLSLSGGVVDPSHLSESELKKAIARTDGNAVGILMFDGTLHYDSETGVGYEGGGLTAERIVACAKAKDRYSVALFESKAFSETDAAKRAYEKGRELALLAELSAAGIREILVFGLPTEEAFVTEVGLYMAQVLDFSPHTYVGVVLPGGARDAEIARLVASTEKNVDCFAIDFHELDEESTAQAIEKNAYFLTQYNMRVLVAEASEAESSYELKSCLVYGAE